MAWEVEYTDEFERWWDNISESEQEAITAAVSMLEERGPGLGRPLVDTLVGSRHPNMKELRVLGTLRVLFAFDPRRAAILLVGGDKRDQSGTWYEQMIPLADELYDDHLKMIEAEPKEKDG